MLKAVNPTTQVPHTHTHHITCDVSEASTLKNGTNPVAGEEVHGVRHLDHHVLHLREVPH